MRFCSIFAFVGLLLTHVAIHAADFDLAAKAMNELGVDLHHQVARGDEKVKRFKRSE